MSTDIIPCAKCYNNNYYNHLILCPITNQRICKDCLDKTSQMAQWWQQEQSEQELEELKDLTKTNKGKTT